MEDVAERVRSTLEQTVGREEMVGVSYYDEGEIGHVFRSEWAEEKYEPEQVDEIVRDLQLESLSHGFHEEVQEESLNATVRIYDEMLDIAVPTNETKGVVVALDADGDYSLREVVETIERTTGDAESATHSTG